MLSHLVLLLQEGGRIVFNTHSFWKDLKHCPSHQTDGTVRCTACQRLKPRKEHDQWVELKDGRELCLSCINSVVVDTQDAQPLYSKACCLPLLFAAWAGCTKHPF